jgi:hypothetical protein
MFERPELAAKLTAMAHLPAVKASIERAAALNAPKLAILDLAERCKTWGGSLQPEQVVFFRDLPHRLFRPYWTDENPGNPRRDEYAYVPLNWHGAPFGEDGGRRGDHDYSPARAWHFRRDPAEFAVLIDDDPEIIHGDAPGKRNYLYAIADLHGVADSAFLAVYRKRLRRLLAEAVPGVGAL